MMRVLQVLSLVISGATAFTLSPKPVSALLADKAGEISNLKEQATAAGVDISQQPYSNDVFFLRYCLNDDGDDNDASATLAENLKWRSGEGKAICDAAQTAIQAAMSEEGKWNNDPVMAAAPSSAKITKYLTPSTTLTTTTSSGDLIYCIRAGKIDDAKLMGSLESIDEMIGFFVYCKEVNAAVANEYSLRTDRLVALLTANDLSGVKIIGGDATFRQALSASSKISSPLYPNLNGPTLLLNLPRLLGALVKLFTPLFPPEVKKRLRFEQGPLSKVKDLMDVAPSGGGRAKFLGEIDELVYNDEK